MSRFVVMTPVPDALLICSKPFSDLTGPLKVVFAIIFLLKKTLSSWLVC
jgi:hypothetical protein